MLSKFAAAGGVGWVLAYTGYAYQFGLSTIAVVPAFIISFLVFALWAGPRIYKESREKKFYTQGDYVLAETGSRAARQAVDWISIVVYLFWVLISFIGGAKVIEHLGVLPYEGALLVTAFVVLVYILISGFKAVVVTDVIQSIIILILSVVVFGVVIGENNILAILEIETSSIDVLTLLGIFMYGFFSLFASADRYQLCFSAKNVRQIQHGLSYAVIPIAVVIGMLLIIGMYMYGQSPALDPDTVFVVFLTDFLPANLLAIGAVMFFAGLMSSADTSIYTATSYATFLTKRKDPVKFLRQAIVVIVILETLAAYFFRDIIGATIIAAVVALIPSLAMIYIIAAGKSSKKFLASLGGGVLGAIVGFAVFKIDPAAITGPVVGGALGLLWKK